MNMGKDSREDIHILHYFESQLREARIRRYLETYRHKNPGFEGEVFHYPIQEKIR